MRKLILASFVILLFAGCATTSYFQITDKMVQPVIDAQLAEMEDAIEKGTPVTVWWCDDERFKQADELDRNSTIAYWVQGYIERKLVNSKKFDVVTRTQLEKIFREQDFQHRSGRVDQDTLVSSARILGAKYMVVPIITVLSTLNIQILNSETGKIIYISDTPVKENQKVGK
jgi:curli biogenesis system outer membrane secretion channel CsgG